MKKLLFEGKRQLQRNESLTRGISDIVTTIIVWQHKVAECEWFLRLNPHRASSEASDLCNGSGTHLERQVKSHCRLAWVTLPLPLMLTLDAPVDAQRHYLIWLMIMLLTI